MRIEIQIINVLIVGELSPGKGITFGFPVGDSEGGGVVLGFNVGCCVSVGKLDGVAEGVDVGIGVGGCIVGSGVLFPNGVYTSLAGLGPISPNMP